LSFIRLDLEIEVKAAVQRQLIQLNYLSYLARMAEAGNKISGTNRKILQPKRRKKGKPVFEFVRIIDTKKSSFNQYS